MAYQSFSDMQIAYFEKCEDLLEEVILGRAAPVVDVSEGHGEIARACEDRGFKAKTWVPGGLAAAKALLRALQHLLRKQRLLAAVISFQQQKKS